MKIIAYKGFDKNLKCRDFQYEIGKNYKHKGEIIPCASGFHACVNPMDVWDYYSFDGENRFCEVELSGEIKTEENKSCAAKIKINAELKLPDIIKKTIDFIFQIKKYKSSGDDSKLAASGNYSQLAASGNYSKLAASGYNSQLAASGNYSKLAASGDDSKLAASGYNSQLAASGYNSQLAASGNYSQLAASGNYSQLAASGNYSKLAASGNYSQLAASGNYSQLAASGNYSQLAASGNYSQLAASGNYSQLESKGDNCILAGIGYNNTAKGIVGNWIVLSEYDDEGKIICVKSDKIDGKKLKADTWYCLKNKKFTEVK